MNTQCALPCNAAVRFEIEPLRGKCRLGAASPRLARRVEQTARSMPRLQQTYCRHVPPLKGWVLAMLADRAAARGSGPGCAALDHRPAPSASGW